MKKLKNFEKKYLKALAHKLKPVVLVGQNGVTLTVIDSINEALDRHELIKIKFVDYKEKEFKDQLTEVILKETKSYFVSIIGHTLIIYRQSSIEKNRKIKIPKQ